MLIFLLCLLYTCYPDGICVNQYYVYVFESCSCPPPCKAKYFISESTANCLTELLNESDMSCIYVDESVCNGVTFSGYVKGIILDQNCSENNTP